MKMVRLFFLWLALAVAPALAGEAGPSYELGVDGLACPFCAYGIEKELSTVEGVEHTGVDIGRGVVTVRMKEGATLDERAADEATRRAGFGLRSFERLAAD
jgi:mercuric ion binding protein